ncbi:MAG: hypothetical protein ABSD76_17030 [Terriglobales bacterium]
MSPLLMTLLASLKVIAQNLPRSLRQEIEFNCNRASVPEGQLAINPDFTNNCILKSRQPI